jgi:hypothetical protein
MLHWLLGLRLKPCDRICLVCRGRNDLRELYILETTAMESGGGGKVVDLSCGARWEAWTRSESDVCQCLRVGVVLELGAWRGGAVKSPPAANGTRPPRVARCAGRGLRFSASFRAGSVSGAARVRPRRGHVCARLVRRRGEDGESGEASRVFYSLAASFGAGSCRALDRWHMGRTINSRERAAVTRGIDVGSA